MFHYETKAVDALVRIDDQPLWVRVQAVDAIQPDEYPNDHRTLLLLRNGKTVTTAQSVDDVIEILGKAMKDAPL